MRLPWRVMRGVVREVFEPANPRAIPKETDQTRLIRAGLQAGNGRSCTASSSELEERLIADGVAFDREVLEATLRLMFKDGRLRQDADDRFYVADDSPLFVRAKPEPAPSVAEIETHTGWGQMHGPYGGWVETTPYWAG